jgi:GAF domain-containing protein
VVGSAEALLVSRCIISEYHEGDELLTPLVAYERQPSGGAGDAAGGLPAPRPSGRLLLGQGVHVEQAADPALDPAVREELHERGEHTSLNVPLLYKSQPLGLMRLIETRDERHFNSDEIELARGIGEQGALAFQNARLYSSLERLAVTDGLTGLYNHRYFYERLAQEVARAARYQLPLSLLMLDVDDMIACPSCGAENSDRARFCMECAAPLDGPPPIAEERKVVTTLFCDLVGSRRVRAQRLRHRCAVARL